MESFVAPPFTLPKRSNAPALGLSALALARSWDRDRDRAPIAKREPPLIMPWICKPCNDWTEEGSYALGACTRCLTPRPADQPARRVVL